MNSGDSIRVVHPLFQEEDGGSTPTSPLQLHIDECHVSKAIELNALWHSRLPIVSQSNITRSPKKVCFAAYFENQFYASAIWTSPVARMLNNKGMLELRRLAISGDAPKNTGSRMLKIMRLLVVKKFSDIETLISYQDTDVHKGTIYSGAGWHITNKSKPSASGWNTRKRAKMQTTAEKVRWEYKL